MPHSRCPYCGLAVIGHLADHIAFSLWCAGEQMAEWAGLAPSQPLSED